jgi:predicted metal-dependent phosphoesterase TrpH
MIDLHVHSNASDGMLSPSEVVRAAKQAGLSAVALTDHDTTAGLSEALVEAVRGGPEVVPGVELSLEFGPGSLHLIGLFIDPEDAALDGLLRRLRQGRSERNLRIAARLGELGVPVTIEEVAALARGEVVSRPHFARALLRRGHVGSLKEAFDRFLRKNGPAYVERWRPGAKEAISAVRGGGGVAVLCHPHTLGLGEGEALSECVAGLAALGLDALEAYYPDYDRRQSERFEALARRCGLLVSGGSDFHGPPVSESRLGTGRGGLSIPDGVLADLRALTSGRTPRRGSPR